MSRGLGTRETVVLPQVRQRYRGPPLPDFRIRFSWVAFDHFVSSWVSDQIETVGGVSGSPEPVTCLFRSVPLTRETSGVSKRRVLRRGRRPDCLDLAPTTPDLPRVEGPTSPTCLTVPEPQGTRLKECSVLSSVVRCGVPVGNDPGLERRRRSHLSLSGPFPWGGRWNFSGGKGQRRTGRGTRTRGLLTPNPILSLVGVVFGLPEWPRPRPPALLLLDPVLFPTSFPFAPSFLGARTQPPSDSVSSSLRGVETGWEDVGPDVGHPHRKNLQERRRTVGTYRPPLCGGWVDRPVRVRSTPNVWGPRVSSCPLG